MSFLLRCVPAALFLFVGGCGQHPPTAQQAFVTDYGLGPDKWATAWLLTKKVDPSAKLLVAKINGALAQGTSFDVPTSPLRRRHNKTTFEAARDSYGVDDPDVLRLAQVVHDIEVDFWGQAKAPESPLVEHAYRSLQQRQGRDAVSPECYVAFFDSVYEAIRTQRTSGQPVEPADLLGDCREAVTPLAPTRLVQEMRIADLLDEMSRGKRVVFVDVRESYEFDESHIPGALNVSLRDLDSAAIDRVKDADYVVSYCVKDFRGFEMAKALKDAGVRNSVILNPYGIKGWVSEGLPVAGATALSEADAVSQLTGCLEAGGNCLRESREPGGAES